MHYPDKNKYIEILAVVLTGILKFVFMDWLNFRAFYIVAVCAFWIIYIWQTHKKYPGVYKYLGFRKANFKKSFLILLVPALITIAGIYFYGVETEARFLNWRILPILVLYPLWGLLQQFMIAGLIAGNLQKLESIKLRDSLIIIITSMVFALIHAPSLPLMLYVLVMEIIFLLVYFKYHNLWTLGLFHGWVSGLFLYFVLGRDLWKELWVIF